MIEKKRIEGVERAHRTHLDKFYAFHKPESDLQSLNKSLRAWKWVYNHVRPHRSLDNLSPKQYIDTNYPQLTPNCLTCIEPIQFIDKVETGVLQFLCTLSIQMQGDPMPGCKGLIGENWCETNTVPQL